MNTDGLRGFTGLRTRPIHPFTSERPERRRCSVCGAYLRDSNLTDTCATQRCSGIVIEDLTDAELAIIESDSTHGAKMVVRLRTGKHPNLNGGKEARNEAIRQMHEQGMSRANIAERFGLAKGSVNDIIWRRYGQ